MQRIWLALEWAILFLGLPLLYFFEIIPLPKLLGLAAFTLLIVILLIRERTFSFRKACSLKTISSDEWRKLLIRATIIIPSIIIFSYVVTPSTFLTFPREAPLIWLMVMFFYPLFSAIPQEIIYRGFFFVRYRRLFGTSHLLILMSALSFGYLHIIYDSFISIALTFLAGLIWARTYERSKSLSLVIIEHALYGAIGFTFGLGAFFYEETG